MLGDRFGYFFPKNGDSFQYSGHTELKVLAGTFSLCLFNDFLFVLLTLLISLKSKEAVGLYHRHLNRYIINGVYHQWCLPPALR